MNRNTKNQKRLKITIEDKGNGVNVRFDGEDTGEHAMEFIATAAQAFIHSAVEHYAKCIEAPTKRDRERVRAACLDMFYSIMGLSLATIAANWKIKPETIAEVRAELDEIEEQERKNDNGHTLRN